jgi:hypothetical protein
VTGLLQDGVTFDVQAWLKMMSDVDVKLRFMLQTTSTGSGTQYFSTSHIDLRLSDGWRSMTKEITPTWSGTLTWAVLWIATDDSNTSDFLVDDVVFKEGGSDRTIFRKLLSPTTNPFGPETNARGIYLIDLDDERIFIKSSRILGTLVLIKPNSASRIGDGSPLSWEPAVAGLPALLVTRRDVTINPSDAGLAESDLNVNFNPPGSSFGGNSDSDMSDTYLSEIKGLVYGTHTVKFKNRPSLTGAVIAGSDIEISGPLTLSYNPGYFYNPPPGFNGPEAIRILLNSARKPLD